MLETDLMEPVEKLATTPTRCTLAAGAKGMALDMVRGKIATIRTIFDFMDELDVMEGNLEPRRRGRPVRMPEEVEAAYEAAAAFENEQETDGSVHPVSQRIIEEPPSPMWGGYTDEAPGSGSKAESPSAATQAGAPPLIEGKEQGRKAEWERSFLTEAARNARRVPSEKELRQQEEQAEMDRQRHAYESVAAKVKAFAEAHGYDFPGTGTAEAAKDSVATPSEGQGIINSHPEEGPNKRALRQRFERLAWANRMEAERKAALAAKAEGSLMLRQAQHEVFPRPEPVEGRASETSMHEPEPLPDYAIWMRGQRAPP
jgi:hypothetical protein